MAEQAAAGRYWCHACDVAVRPAAGGLELKCPHCHLGFLEEMETARGAVLTAAAADEGDGAEQEVFPGADRPSSVWAHAILSTVDSSVRRRRNRRHPEADGDLLDWDEHDFTRRRRRVSAFLRLLHELRERQLQRLEVAAGVGLEGGDQLTPFGRSLFIGAAGAADHGVVGGGEHGVALGDYFLGPSLDALVQQLAEGEAGRHGTPPAKKEAIEAMPTVEIGGGSGGGGNDDDAATCAVCLETYAPGEHAREMPCRHRFHGNCIVSWLKMHGSCPVCRFQLPADDGNKSSCASGGGGYVSADQDGSDNGGGDGRAEPADNAEPERNGGAEAEASSRRLPASIQWLNSLFPPSAPPSGGGGGGGGSSSGGGSQHWEN